MQKRKLIHPILLAALMGMIFFFSSQPAQESDETSGHFTTLAAHLFISNLDEFDPETQAKIIDGFSFIVRKAAHFCEFALLGCLTLWTAYIKNKRVIRNLMSAGFVCLAVAVADEMIQITSPGRSAEVVDVTIDFFGACAGALFFIIVLSIVKLFKKT